MIMTHELKGTETIRRNQSSLKIANVFYHFSTIKFVSYLMYKLHFTNPKYSSIEQFHLNHIH